MILVFMPFIKNKILKLIPPALVVILVAIPFGLFFKLNVIHDVNLFEHIYSFDPSKLLVKLPDSFFGGITLPDFSQITSFTSIKYIVMFALIGSIESLLTGKAVDGLDPDKRKSDLNKDLWAVGFGNIVSGMIGGLPMISEVVRSSANVNNGAKTRFANMFHGLFLFAFVLLAAPFIMMIPNAALAAMLIFTGWRLASPKEFVNAYKVGPEQFIVFIVTIGLTLYVDLLVGVFVGIITKIVIHVMMGFKLTDLFKGQFELNKQSDSAVITINGPAVFSNFLSFQKLIDSVPPKDKLTLDFSYSNYIDHSFLENIHIYEEDFFHNGGKLEIKGMENFHYLSNHPFSGRKKINNPIFKSQIINLSSRQRFINNWAISNGFDYEAKVPLTIFKVNLSSFPISRRIKDVESVILKQNDNYSLMIADLKIQEGAMMTQENYIMNLVSLSGFKNELPDFVLEKEDITDLLKRFTGFKDINFDQYPVFSKKYFLSSDNESQVRKIFAQNVIQLLENNPIYFVMCRNNQIIIHKDNNLWNTTKYDQEIAFIIELTHCFIYNNQ